MSNPSFATGNLNGWTPFTSSGNGMLGTGLPGVTAFSPDGSPPSNAVQFQVGQQRFAGFTDLQGGGIYQTLVLPKGPISLSADLAVRGGTSNNLFGGVAQLLIDFVPVASYDFGAVSAGQIKRVTLNEQILGDALQHTLAVNWLRPAEFGPDTPYQYVQNFYAYDDWDYDAFGYPVPEPGTGLLLALGLLFVAWRGREHLRPRRLSRRH